jgi:hypothetical protein
VESYALTVFFSLAGTFIEQRYHGFNSLPFYIVDNLIDMLASARPIISTTKKVGQLAALKIPASTTYHRTTIKPLVKGHLMNNPFLCLGLH